MVEEICPECGKKMSTDRKSKLRGVTTGNGARSQLYIDNVLTLYCEEHREFHDPDDLDTIDKIVQMIEEAGLRHVYGGGRTMDTDSTLYSLEEYFEIRQMYGGGGFDITVDIETIKPAINT